MAYYLKLYAVSLVVFLAIDALWLGLVAPRFYQDQLGSILASDPNWAAAAVFYLLFVIGIVVFVVVPGLESGSLGKTLLRAALFGLIAYATYDLTNLATIEGWPVLVTVVDMVWGMVVSALVAAGGYGAGRRLGGHRTRES